MTPKNRPIPARMTSALGPRGTTLNLSMSWQATIERRVLDPSLPKGSRFVRAEHVRTVTNHTNGSEH